MHPQRRWRAGRRPLLALVVTTVLVGAVGCTRTHDLLAAPVDQTTTTERVPVRSVPRRATTTTSAVAATPGAEVAGATTTVAPPAGSASAPRSSAKAKSTTPTTVPLSALLAALRAAATTTTVAPSAAPTTAATTTTTSIPANPAGVVVTAQNPLVHHGETQTISVAADGSAPIPTLVACAGRDYRLTSDGFVSAGFTSRTTCGSGDAATLTRTLPANIAYGQYVFCTEIDPSTPTTVCTAYVAVPYPT